MPPSPLRHPLALVIGSIALLWMLGLLIVSLSPILSPFVLGAILAYIGTPLAARLARLGLGRTTAAVLVLCAFIGIIALLAVVLIPLVQHEIAALAKRLPQMLVLLEDQFAPWLQKTFGIHPTLDAQSLRTLLTDNADTAQSLAQHALGYLGSGSAALLGIVSMLLIAPVVTFYLLRDWHALLAALARWVPRAALPRVESIAVRIDRVLAEFLRGQLGVMAALALFYSVALWIAGLDFALAIGLITGALVFIPYVGFLAGLGLALLISVQQGWPVWAFTLAIFGAGQVLESFILTPRLIGERIGLHPLAVIFALMAFGQIFGFIGILLALPASAVLLVALRELRAAYMKSTFYREPPDNT